MKNYLNSLYKDKEEVTSATPTQVTNNILNVFVNQDPSTAGRNCHKLSYAEDLVKVKDEVIDLID